ncbi:diablo IAP-binding mitochondrial protein-like isoform X2 [Periplaneta americana]|uniref:diablo IAP-binding mitochondrial protein-like isoform X2 n=1 Tax=Periplaneta americana TaxID=6978 RepID=UPI0037E868D3
MAATRLIFHTMYVARSTFFQYKIPRYILKLPNTNMRRASSCLKTSLFFTVAQCAYPVDKDNKLIQPPSPHTLTNEYMISQACTSSITATQQLLTVTLSAIIDTAKSYRECMERLMSLMDDSLQVQGSMALQSDVWDQVVAMRIKVGDCKKKLQELSSFMEYVDKLATSAAETAYLGGAEHMSTVMCETINSAHAKLAVEYEKTKAVEKDFLKQQETFVKRACDIEKELKKREEAVKVGY